VVRLKNKKLIYFVLNVVVAIIMASIANAAEPKETGGNSELQSAEKALTQESKVNLLLQITVSFNSNGADGQVPDNVEIQSGSKIILPGADSLTLNGYVFRAWAQSTDDTSPKYFAGDLFAAADSVTLYAVWQKVGINTVTYALAEGATLSESVTTGMTPQQTPIVPDTTRTFVGWKDDEGNFIVPADIIIFTDETFTAHYAVALNITDHNKYMNGFDTGLFKAEAPLTRGEACQMLYNLMTETDEITVSLPENEKNSWYYKAISTMASMGFLYGDGTGDFRPDGNITRSEFVAILSRFYPVVDGDTNFTDVSSDNWAAKAVSSAEAKGWIIGSSDGLFRPNDAITRAEAAVIMNRVLQRTASRAVIDSSVNIRIFPDLSKNYWAYYDIMEATIDHTYSKASGTEVWLSYTEEKADIRPGFQFIEGQLYYEDASGYFIKDTTLGTFTFDRLGRSTTGNEELDLYITAAVLQITNPSMTQLQMLREVFDYARDSFTYYKRDYYVLGDRGFENKQGLIMFQTGSGNCYCFASVFALMSRRLGYDSEVISGVVGSHDSPHGWVEIVFDNTTYIFDPGLEMAYMRNGIPSYNLFFLSYDNLPWPYIK
jgi:hypothetical protein